MSKHYILPSNSRHKYTRGLTLLELVTVITVLAVMTAIAAPNFPLILERWRTQQASADLQSTLTYARVESIRRGGGISLVKRQCNESTEWSCGWILVVDSDQNGQQDNQTDVLQETLPLKQTSINSSESGDAILFDRWGGMRFVGNTNASSFHFTVQSDRKSLDTPPIVCIFPGGQIRTTKAPNTCESLYKV